MTCVEVNWWIFYFCSEGSDLTGISPNPVRSVTHSNFLPYWREDMDFCQMDIFPLSPWQSSFPSYLSRIQFNKIMGWDGVLVRKGGESRKSRNFFPESIVGYFFKRDLQLVDQDLQETLELYLFFKSDTALCSFSALFPLRVPILSPTSGPLSCSLSGFLEDEECRVLPPKRTFDRLIPYCHVFPIRSGMWLDDSKGCAPNFKPKDTILLEEWI